jgi:hypothetical protein
MIAEIYDVIVARLLTLAAFPGLGPGLSSQDLPLPSAKIYLSTESEAVDDPGQRLMTFAIDITVGHNEEPGASQRQIYDLIDLVRGALDGFQPPNCIAINGPFAVAKTTLQAYADHGNTVYTLQVGALAWPETFAMII